MGIIRAALRKVLPRSVHQRLRTVKSWILLKLYKRRVIEASFGGANLRILLADPMAEAWYGKGGGSELTEIGFFTTSKLKPGACVFDVGAHHGVVALQLAAKVTPGGKVLAIESNPVSAKVCEENFALNPGLKASVVAKAIAAKPGTMKVRKEWHVQHIGEGGSEVDCVTIDVLAQAHGKPDVLFIDVEGFECEALGGASETLKHCPDVYVEVHQGCGLESHGGDLGRVMAFFPQTRYRIYAVQLDEGDADMVVPFDKSLAFVGGRFGLLAVARKETAA